MREVVIERYLVKVMKSIGGRCIKLDPTNNRGIPDRMCLFPDGRVVFVEVKGPKGETSEMQKLWIDWLKKHKFKAYVINSRARVDAFIDVMMRKGATDEQ